MFQEGIVRAQVEKSGERVCDKIVFSLKELGSLNSS